MFARSALVVAIVAAAAFISGAFAQEPNCARNYTVVPGDTCDGIGAKTNTPTFQIETVNANRIDAGCDNLFVGEPLCLGIVGQDCDITHVVQPGDNCDTIAQQAKTTRQILLANNPNVNTACTNINLGEVLCTANEIIVHSTASSA
ncbi:uncharacterized protein TRAVEDRAFT_22532 [Trametes versicolor FP-101664 SS1]|uniref:uncharacterized protein n=1 Tax=Trametes versicolor (strain FP-101664) TaxID=717944 RepID=UPI0004622047|nr:uncharacterized protein TRAVEDRAFT_22532 [Trametes versicolor FP-101664 SS1]EIW56219.1 hypothetical protein TRAVEDRAFT_22532 [Trametes versicolor FP-101664 SS1]